MFLVKDEGLLEVKEEAKAGKEDILDLWDFSEKSLLHTLRVRYLDEKVSPGHSIDRPAITTDAASLQAATTMTTLVLFLPPHSPHRITCDDAGLSLPSTLGVHLRGAHPHLHQPLPVV